MSNIPRTAKKAGRKSRIRKEANPEVTAVLPVTNMAALTEQFSQKLRVRVPVGGEKIGEFECERLREAQTVQVARVLQKCLPPLIRKRGEDGTEQMHYDVTNPDYLAKKDEAQRQARALAVWLGWPPVREGNEAETDVAKITEIVGEKLPERVIRAIAQEVVAQDVDTEQMVHFLSKAGFQMG